MSQRRQEKMARVIKEAVSDIINNHLQDPRIEGFISVTEVKIEPDLKKADVFLSIMGKTSAKQQSGFYRHTARCRPYSGIARRLCQKQILPASVLSHGRQT